MTKHTPPTVSYESTFDYTLDVIKNGHLHLAEHKLVGRIDVKQTHGSIILPDSAQHELNTATIVLIADNLAKADFPIGAHFIPAQASGLELCSKGNDRLVVYDVREDIHGIFLLEEKPAETFEIAQEVLDRR